MLPLQRLGVVKYGSIAAILAAIPLLVAAHAEPGQTGVESLHHAPKHQYDAHAWAGRGNPRTQEHPRGFVKYGKRSFIKQIGDKLMLDGKVFRFASCNAPDLMGVYKDFEIEDTMQTFAAFGTRVLRIFTLSIEGTSPAVGIGSGHLAGWDAAAGNWRYNETKFRQLDSVLALAAKYDVRLIIPFINQELGSVETNYVGNWVDLIVHRYQDQGWDYNTAKSSVDFYTDRTMIDSFKQIITYLLNRKNTINGIRYGDDPTILAWETGNELAPALPVGGSGTSPRGVVPGAWTAEIAAHVKTLAPNTLVADGSFAARQPVEKSYALEALQSKDVNLFSYHYFLPDYLTNRFEQDTAYVRQFGKPFMVGQYGFVNPDDFYAGFLEGLVRAGTSGSLIWSFRSHSNNTGFKVHREDANNAGYHLPGWPNPTTSATWKETEEWDVKEFSIMQNVYRSSFAINGKAVPSEYPVPGAPDLWLVNGTRNITWRGAAWANDYEVWVSTAAIVRGTRDDKFTRIASGVLDAMPARNMSLGWPLPSAVHGTLKVRGVSLSGKPGKWSNTIKI